MNRKIFLAFLAVLPLASGCIITSGGPPQRVPSAGDVTFSWTFAGQGCPSNVQTLHIDIPGEVLANDGNYPCVANGYPGIVLHDFAPGSYSFTVTAYDYSNQPLYTGHNTFSVDGNVLVNVDLTPTGSPGSYAYLTWTFPASAGCADHGITNVYVQIDSATATRYDCSTGFTAAGAQTGLIAPGQHNLVMWATDATNYTYYSLSTTLTTATSAPVAQQCNLQWAVGGTNLTWSMMTNSSNGNHGVTCTQSQTTTMAVTFVPVSGGAPLYGVLNDPTTWDRIDNFCAKYLYLYWNYLPAGTYNVYMRATDSLTSPQFTYDSDFNHPPQVTITAGQEVGPGGTQNHALTVPMKQTP